MHAALHNPRPLFIVNGRWVNVRSYTAVPLEEMPGQEWRRDTAIHYPRHQYVTDIAPARWGWIRLSTDRGFIILRWPTITVDARRAGQRPIYRLTESGASPDTHEPMFFMLGGIGWVRTRP